MRSFFFPRKLLAPRSAYIAALHRDKNIARLALIDWTTGQQPDDLAFQQHKLVMLTYERFKEEPELFPLLGIYKNIHRHCLLRAHVNLSSMNTLLAHSGFDGAEVFAIGGTHLKLECGASIPCDLDTIEWGTNRQEQQQVSEAIIDAGAVVIRPPRYVTGRRAILQSFSNKNDCLIRLVTFKSAPALTKHNSRLFKMTQQAHLDFLASAQASLLARRDQYIFNSRGILDANGKGKPAKRYAKLMVGGVDNYCQCQRQVERLLD